MQLVSLASEYEMCEHSRLSSQHESWIIIGGSNLWFRGFEWDENVLTDEWRWLLTQWSTVCRHDRSALKWVCFMCPPFRGIRFIYDIIVIRRYSGSLSVIHLKAKWYPTDLQHKVLLSTQETTWKRICVLTSAVSIAYSIQFYYYPPGWMGARMTLFLFAQHSFKQIA